MSNYYVICIIIGIIAIFTSDISSLGGILGIICSNYCIFSSNIAHLTQNVVLLDICKYAQNRYIAQYIQLLTPLFLLISCLHSIQLLLCILPIKLASNVHMLYRMKNKPIQNLRGV